MQKKSRVFAPNCMRVLEMILSNHWDLETCKSSHHSRPHRLIIFLYLIVLQYNSKNIASLINKMVTRMSMQWINRENEVCTNAVKWNTLQIYVSTLSDCPDKCIYLICIWCTWQEICSCQWCYVLQTPHTHCKTVLVVRSKIQYLNLNWSINN